MFEVGEEATTDVTALMPKSEDAPNAPKPPSIFFKKSDDSSGFNVLKI